MRKINVKSIYVLIGMLLMGFSILIHYIQIHRYNQLLNSIPFLVKNEKPSYFELVGVNSDRLTISDLRSSLVPITVCIFKQSCSPCDQNVIFWEKIRELTSGKSKVIGIVIGGDQEAFSLEEKIKGKIPLYVPENIDQFIKSWRIYWDYSQTIVFHRGAVKLLNYGQLSHESTIEIIKSLKNFK